MVSLTRSLRAAGAMLAAVMLASCSGATEPGASPAGDPSTAPMEEPATSPPETTEAEPTSAEPSDDMTDSAPPAAEGPLTLSMAESDLGEILVDGNGLTLYLFTMDTQGADASTCEGQCLVNWPPLIGEPDMGEGVDDSLLGSFTKSDGTVQATYNGWPLYYWAQDTEPGQTTGQGVQGVWFVLDSAGNAIGG